MRLCTVFIKENQFDEALKLVSLKYDPQISDISSFIHRFVSFKTLDALAVQGSAEKVKYNLSLLILVLY